MNKVSVAVPVYNVENYIYDMLKSVQNQTFKDFEVVIIDDAPPTVPARLLGNSALLTSGLSISDRKTAELPRRGIRLLTLHPENI